MEKLTKCNNFIALKVSRGFVFCMVSFLVGFLVAWLIWAQTTAYIFAVLHP